MNRYVIICVIISIILLTVFVVITTDRLESQQPIEYIEFTNIEQKITVFASFYPYYEFTKNVAGDSAVVEQFIESGIAAHDWEPRAREIQKLQDADAFVYNGLQMEPYVDSIIESGEFNNISFIKASTGVPLLKPHGSSEDTNDDHDMDHDDEHGTKEHVDDDHDAVHDDDVEHDVVRDDHDDHKDERESIHVHNDNDFTHDPHIWLDPILVKQQVENIRDGLISVDPDNAVQYENNADAYNVKLDALDAKIKSELSMCERDTFVAFHNAFTYFADRYDLNVLTVSGFVPNTDASAAKIATFVNYVKDNDINVIFAEEFVNPRLTEVIAEEAGAQVMTLSTIETLPDIDSSAGLTYFDKMEQNLDALKIALECQ